MHQRPWTLLTIPVTLGLSLFAAAEPGLEVHDDYYRGFAHGAYYGLMLAGVDYHVAWCMKAELEHEAESMGTGADFQRKLEALLDKCRQQNSDEEAAATDIG